MYEYFINKNILLKTEINEKLVRLVYILFFKVNFYWQVELLCTCKGTQINFPQLCMMKMSAGV